MPNNFKTWWLVLIGKVPIVNISRWTWLRLWLWAEIQIRFWKLVIRLCDVWKRKIE
jgi:hypothetical protein